MRVDPKTAVRSIAAAFPAAVVPLRRLGIDVTAEDSLYRACEKAGVAVADVEKELDTIDWSRNEDGSSGLDAKGRTE